MLSMTRTQATVPPVVDATGDPITGSGASESRDGAALGQHVQAFDGPAQGVETRRGHSRRMARRTRLHGYALVAVALFAFVVALSASNTAHVKVSWLFGSSHVSLVWLILAAAILGWLLGLVTNTALHRRTRAPRQGHAPATDLSLAARPPEHPATTVDQHRRLLMEDIHINTHTTPAPPHQPARPQQTPRPSIRARSIRPRTQPRRSWP